MSVLEVYGTQAHNNIDSDVQENLAMKANRRKTPATAKAQRLEARISAHQKRRFEYAAQLRGTSLTGFLVQSATEAANRTIEEHQVMQLSERDTKIFVESLLNPRPPSPKLVEAVKSYREWLKRQ